MAPTLLIMIDGLGADAFERHRAHLPHLHALAEAGTRVRALDAHVPGTSLTGRTGILTGVEADRHGVYGNFVLDGDVFRYANPDDVVVPTLPRRASEAGLDVAVLGYGMVRPEDARTFHHAWWTGEMLQRARDLEPIPADEGWLRTSRHRDDSGRLARLAEAGLPDGVPDAYAGDRLHYLLAELEGDRTMMRYAAGVLTQDPPPDLVVTEILTPDSVQHAAGVDDPFSIWSLAYADGLVGTLLHELEAAGRRDDTTIVITSDHGHGPVSTAYHPEALLPGTAYASEGTVLHVRVPTAAARADATARLGEHGIDPLPGDHLPDAVRERVAAFVAPDGASFEPRTQQAKADDPHAVHAPARVRSTHGFRPGHPADRRFWLAAGPNVPTGVRPAAPASAVEATVARRLGLVPFGDGPDLLAGDT
ncbi:MAG: alkaline phosphatase family protein [Trueperaceae bacterium]